MTELQLYKFVTDNEIEWHWRDNSGTPDVVIFPRFYQAEDFCKMLSNHIFEDGIECVMMDGYLAIWMNDICEYMDIEIENCFPKDKEP